MEPVIHVVRVLTGVANVVSAPADARPEAAASATPTTANFKNLSDDKTGFWDAVMGSPLTDRLKK
jgi:hypothetical protein